MDLTALSFLKKVEESEYNLIQLNNYLAYYRQTVLNKKFFFSKIRFFYSTYVVTTKGIHCL